MDLPEHKFTLQVEQTCRVTLQPADWLRVNSIHIDAPDLACLFVRSIKIGNREQVTHLGTQQWVEALAVHGTPLKFDTIPPTVNFEIELWNRCTEKQAIRIRLVGKWGKPKN